MTLNIFPLGSETWDEYWERANTSVDAALENANIERWDFRILELQWKWAGHAARLDLSHAVRMMLDYRDIRWDMEVNRPLGRAQLRRPRRGHPHVRWEARVQAYVEKHFHQDWKVVAQDRNLWRQHARKFVAYTLGFDLGADFSGSVLGDCIDADTLQLCAPSATERHRRRANDGTTQKTC